MTTKERKNFKLGHSRNEAFGDSDPGLRYFAKRGCTRVDGNGLLSRNMVPMNMHYRLFLRHGFERRDGQHVNRALPACHFTAQELEHLFWYAKNHYCTIEPTIDRIRLAFELGMDYEFEPKEHMKHAVADTLYGQVQDLRREFPRRKVFVKTLNGRPGTPVYDLRPFHRVGFPTLLTTHQFALATEADAQRWIDEYRGFRPRWVK